ncbi:MAG: hypothetical protein Q7S22_02995 [Candidatus Micrarchaeota archaeon]|nr:hypothetical protein [Candidatus Micrarchaeota archaeon]
MRSRLMFLILLVLVVPLFSINVDYHIKATKDYFYDNESVILTYYISDNDIQYQVNNAVISINSLDTSFVSSIGNIAPAQQVQGNISLGKLNPGIYSLNTLLSYDFIGITNTLPERTIKIEVQPSIPIRMKKVSTIFDSVISTPNPQVNTSFSIGVNLLPVPSNEIFLVYLDKQKITDFSIVNASGNYSKLLLNYTASKAGIHVLELYATKNDNLTANDDYLFYNLLVTDPNSYVYVPMQEIYQKNLSYEAQKLSFLQEFKLEKTDQGTIQLIVNGSSILNTNCSDEDCFGGVQLVLSPPIMTRTGNSIKFYLNASDPNNGAQIELCQIRIDHGNWINMGGEYNKTSVSASYELSGIPFSQQFIEFRCFDSSLNTGYESFGTSESSDVLILTTDSLSSSKTFDNELNKYAASIVEDGLSSKVLKLDDPEVIKAFGLSGDLKDTAQVKTDIQKLISKTKAKYVILVGGADDIPVPTSDFRGEIISSDQFYVDFTGSGIPQIPIARIFGEKNANKTTAIIELLSQFTKLHHDYCVDNGTGCVSSFSLSLDRLGKIAWDDAKLICANPFLKEGTKIAITTGAAALSGGAGAALYGDVSLCVDGACFVVSNWDTMNNLYDGLAQYKETGSTAILEQSVKDGSVFVMAKDGIFLLGEADYIDTGDVKSYTCAIDTTQSATGLYYDATSNNASTTVLLTDALNGVQNSCAFSSKQKKDGVRIYNLLTEGSNTLEDIKNKRYGDILQEAITAGLDNSDPKSNKFDVKKLTLEILNGDPTLRANMGG